MYKTYFSSSISTIVQKTVVTCRTLLLGKTSLSVYLVKHGCCGKKAELFLHW